MIKCEKGVFEAQGSNAALKAELAIIIENLKKCFAEKMGQEEVNAKKEFLKHKGAMLR